MRCRFRFFHLSIAVIIGLVVGSAHATVTLMSNSNGEGPKFTFSPSADLLPGGITEFKIEASDPDGLKCAQFHGVWGAGRGMIDCEPPFNFFVDTRMVEIPLFRTDRCLSITVEDLKGNSTGISYCFDIDRNSLDGLPSVDLTKPVAAYLSPKVDTTTYYTSMSGAFSYIPEDGTKLRVEFAVTDDSSGVQRVELFGSGDGKTGFIRTKDAPPYVFEIDAVGWYQAMPPTATHLPVIYAYMWDKSGNWNGASNYAASRILVFNNHGDVTGPTISASSPVSGATLSSDRKLIMIADVSDPAGLRAVGMTAGVNLSDPAKPTCHVTTPPYTCTVEIPATWTEETFNVAVWAIDKYLNRSAQIISVTNSLASRSDGGGTTTDPKPSNGRGRKKK